MTTYTAWITNDRSCLDSDLCDVVVLANDHHGASTGDPLWSAATTIAHDADDNDELVRQSKELLADAGWQTEGELESVPTGYIVNVHKS